MIRPIVVTALLLTTAATAFAQDVTVTVRNLTANHVDRIEAFAVDQTGQRGSRRLGQVEAFAVDQTGQRGSRRLGQVRDLPSKAAEDFAVSSNGCAPVRFVVSLLDKSQFEVDMDLCTDRVLMLQQ